MRERNHLEDKGVDRRIILIEKHSYECFSIVFFNSAGSDVLQK